MATATPYADHVGLAYSGTSPFLIRRRVKSGPPDLTPLYYVDFTGGDDGDDGLSAGAAWKTLAKLNGLTFDPGDVIGLKRGETWREQLLVPSSGSVGQPITFGAYGLGAKPKILGSLDLHDVTWTDNTGGVWYTAIPDTVDIGNLIFNGEESCGRKCGDGAALFRATTDLTQQGDFFWNVASGRLYLKSASAPGTFYSAIEGARWASPYIRYGVRFNAKSFVTVRNIDFRYQASTGVWVNGSTGPCDNDTIEYCDLSYIGGQEHDSGNLRSGNAIEGWRKATNLIVRNNTIDNIYDAGITQQGQTAGDTASDQLWTGNVISNCEYGWEFFSSGAATVDGVVVDDNRFLNSGSGWAHGQRTNGAMGTGARFGGKSGATYTGNAFTNNHIDGSTEWDIDATALANLTGWDVDHNTYYPDGATKFQLAYVEKNFAGWQTATSQDANSTIEEA